MENYKDNVRSTRTGAFGSSDGKILMQIAELGYVPKSAYRRMAVCKGLCEVQEIPHTAAVRAGDEIELAIFENLKATYPNAESNPLVVSKKYARKNFVLLSHPDIRIKDEEKKLLTYIECKASKYNTEKVRNDYNAQLYIHRLLAEEEARSLGKGWKARVLLAHFNTDGLNLEGGVEFTPDRLTVKPTRRLSKVFDIEKALTIIDEFLEDFNEFYEGESVDEKYLPAAVKQQFDEVAMILAEIKEREKKVDDFKKRLYKFMDTKGLKSIKCDAFSMTRVDSSVSTSFDTKKYLADMREKHPRIAKRIEDNYKKTTVKNGYVLLNVKKTDKE